MGLFRKILLIKIKFRKFSLVIIKLVWLHSWPLLIKVQFEKIFVLIFMTAMERRKNDPNLAPDVRTTKDI
jgi:hypothetical protein